MGKPCLWKIYAILMQGTSTYEIKTVYNKKNMYDYFQAGAY